MSAIADECSKLILGARQARASMIVDYFTSKESTIWPEWLSLSGVVWAFPSEVVSKDNLSTWGMILYAGDKDGLSGQK